MRWFRPNASGMPLLFCAALLLVPGCSKPGGDRRQVIVSAAISLRPALNRIETAFESEHPEIDVVLNYGSSGSLRAQIENGAPVQLFLSAHRTHVDALVDAGFSDPKRVRAFVANTLYLAWSPRFLKENPDTPGKIEALAGPAVRRVAMGAADSVPAGIYAQQVLDFYGLSEKLASRLVYTKDALQVLTYLENGLVDAGLLYGTDYHRSPVLANGFRIPSAAHEPIRYYLIELDSTPGNRENASFAAFLDSAAARALFEEVGFRIDQTPYRAPLSSPGRDDL